jgi:tRNA A22 N-methylase
MSNGKARRDLIIAMCPRDGFIVDVGADHGHVAHAVGAVALEREIQRIGRPDVPWVVGDGLSCFRDVDTAIIAGMGALTIAGILERGPTPRRAIVHAPDDPPTLRQRLDALGWRIIDERLAPEARRFAEVLHIEPGVNEATGLWLELGPVLLRSEDPHLRAHLRHLFNWYGGIATATAGKAQEKHTWAAERATFVSERLQERGWDS